jgi:hypothetical protein
MADLFFPELISGTYAQYPIRKSLAIRAIRNMLLDGSVISAPDFAANRIVWNLSYVELSFSDCDLLRQFYQLCVGGLHRFTFIDPTDNMLRSSSDFNASDWQIPEAVEVQSAGLAQSVGYPAYRFTNTAQAGQLVSQKVSVPSGLQSCFSIYVKSSVESTIELIRQGQNTLDVRTCPVGPSWTRVISAGRLADSGGVLTAGLRLSPGQSISVSGAQLEPQLAPSRYRSSGRGGVYTTAYFGSDSMSIRADAPDSYSVQVRVEAQP